MPVLELTDKQLYTIQEACDLYARVRTGHFDIIWSILAFDCEKNCKQQIPDARLWHAIAEVVKRFWFPELPNGAANYGVGHDIGADRAWTLKEVIKEYYSKDKEMNRAMNWVSGEKMPAVRGE